MVVELTVVVVPLIVRSPETFRAPTILVIPVPCGSRIIFPFEIVEEIVFPFNCRLSTRKSVHGVVVPIEAPSIVPPFIFGVVNVLFVSICVPLKVVTVLSIEIATLSSDIDVLIPLIRGHWNWERLLQMPLRSQRQT